MQSVTLVSQILTFIMAQTWQKLLVRVRDSSIKRSLFDFDPENYSPYNIYANPFAAAYQHIEPPQRSAQPRATYRQRSAASSIAQSLKDQIECIACGNMNAKSKFPVDSITTKCQHGVTICSDCLTLWIEISFHDNIWNHIDCPICGSRLAPEDVNRFGSRDVKNKYLARFS